MADAGVPTVDTTSARELAQWQRRLLPFVIAAVTLMGVFFFASSMIQLNRLGATIAYQPDTRIVDTIAGFEKANPEGARTREHVEWKALILLEEGAIRQRYAQVNATLMLRAWTRHLGFLTGMILALTGAIFILAKLSESETRLSGEGAGVKGALATSSPGIVLAVLGTMLMIVTLTVDFEFSTKDVPVYLTTRQADVGAMPPPPPLDSEAARTAEEQSLFKGGSDDDLQTGDAVR